MEQHDGPEGDDLARRLDAVEQQLAHVRETLAFVGAQLARAVDDGAPWVDRD